MSPRLRLTLALLLPFAACGLQWLLWEDWIKPYVWFLFFPVAFFSAWLGGLAGGIGGTLISALLVSYVFISPQLSFTLQNPSSLFSIGMFLGMGCLFSWFHEKLRRALSASKGRFEATFEQAAVGIALVTPDGHFLRVNHKLCAILGYTPQELIARTFQDITHPDDLDTDLGNVSRMLAGEIDTYAMEKRYFHKNGTIVWSNLTVALTRKPDGAPNYFISMIEDISGRKQMETTLHEREHRLEAIVGYSPSALSLKHPDGRYALANPNVQHIHHLGEAQIVGKTDFDLYPEESARTFQANDRRVLETRGRHVIEEIIPVDGELRTFMSHIFPVLDDAGRTEFICRISLDITDRKRTEDELSSRLKALERFERASIDREQRMIELKRQVNEMARELGRAPPYDLSFVDALQHRGEP